MVYDIEYAYIDKEAQEVYEKHGGFGTPERLLFLSFVRDGARVTGIHLRGGLYGQINKHFECCGLLTRNNLIPAEYQTFINETPTYCGISATNVPHFVNNKQFKQKSKLLLKEAFLKYVEGNNPLFEYRPVSITINPILITYEESKTRPSR